MAIEALDIEIKHQSQNAEDAVQRLLRAIGKLPGALNSAGAAAKAPIKNIEALKSITEQLASSDKTLQSTREQAQAYRDTADAARTAAEAARERAAAARESARAVEEEAKALRAQREQAAVRSAYDAIANSTAYERMQNQIPATFSALKNAFMNGADQSAIDRLAEKSQRLYMQLQFMQKPMEGPIDIDSIVQSSTELDRLQHKLAEVRMALQYSLEQGDTQTHIDSLASTIQNLNEKIAELEAGSEKAGGAVEELGKTSKKSSFKIGKFISMIGRMALYRGIRAALRMITQGISDGVKHFAEWDALTNQVSGANAVKTLNEYGNAFGQLKNSIGAAAMPVMQLFLPAIKQIVSWAVSAANAIAALASALNGMSFFFGASADAGYQFEDSISAAGGAAKELKATILGFDELNVMNDPNSGGGGGGGSSKSGVTGDTFKRMDLPDWLKDLQPIIDDIRGHVDSIKESLVSIWNSSLVQSLVHGDLESFLDGIRTIVSMIDYALASIASLLNDDLLGAVDHFVELLSTSHDSVSKLSELIAGFVTSKWKSLFAFIFGGEENVPDWVNKAVELLGFVNQLAIGNDLGFNPLIGLLLHGVADGIDEISAAWNKAGWKGLLDRKTWDAVIGAISKGFLKSLPESVQEFLNSLHDGNEKIVSAVDKFFLEDIPKAISKLWKRVDDFFKKAKSGLYGGSGVIGKFGPSLEQILSYAQTTINGATQAVTANFRTAWDNVRNFVVNLVIGTIRYRFLSMINDVIANLQPLEEQFNEFIAHVNELFGKNIQPLHFSSIELGEDPSVIYQREKERIEAESAKRPTNFFAEWTPGTDKSLQERITQYKFSANVGSKPTSDFQTKLQSSIDLFRFFGRVSPTVEPGFGKTVQDELDKYSPKVGVTATVTDGFKTSFQNMLNGFHPYVHFTPKLTQTTLTVKIANGNYNQTAKLQFAQAYAEGGFVPSGNLFIAGEAGPELVGRMGSHTAVANNDQITQGIYSAVRDAMAGNTATLQEQNGILREIAEKDTTATISTGGIASGMARMNRRSGVTVMPTYG